MTIGLIEEIVKYYVLDYKGVLIWWIGGVMVKIMDKMVMMEYYL